MLCCLFVDSFVLMLLFLLLFILYKTKLFFIAPSSIKIDSLLDKKLDKINKFTGQIYILLNKLVFFTGQKIPDNYDLFSGQKDQKYWTLNLHPIKKKETTGTNMETSEHLSFVKTLHCTRTWTWRLEMLL